MIKINRETVALVGFLFAGCFCLHEDFNAPCDWDALNARAVKHAQSPIRVGIPGVRPFWNEKSRAFIHPPAFDFGKVPSAAAYRFTLSSSATQCVWRAESPWSPIEGKIWSGLAPDYYTLKVEGVGSAGQVLGKAGERTFYRAAVFHGPYPQSSADYQKAAERVYASVFHLPQVQHWLVSDEPDPQYDLYCYPSKIIASMINALCRYAKAAPNDADQAYAIAQKMADWLLRHSQPADAPLAYFPPTYWSDRRSEAVKYAGQNMLAYPAFVANAYFILAESVGQEKYRQAAIRIARTYLKLQGADGTWPLKMFEKTGELVCANRLIPEKRLFDMLNSAYVATGEDAFKIASARVFDYMITGPCVTWNWEGQFEDVKPLAPYANLQKGLAIFMAGMLAEKGMNRDLVLELVDWCEDQFVVWSDPVHHLDWKNWRTPTALEQYEYYTPIDASMGDMIAGFAIAYKVSGDRLYLEKSKALADNILRNQRENGTIPTYFDSQKGSDWVNCMIYTADRLELLAEVMQN